MPGWVCKASNQNFVVSVAWRVAITELSLPPRATSTPMANISPRGLRGFHLASLRRWAKETGVGRLDVKKRGIRETPEEVRRAVLGGAKPGRRGGAGRHATLVLARVGRSRFALEVTPLD